MQTSLAVTALLMGLAGGPHCIAMCGAACAGMGNAAGARRTSALWTFQAGRLVSYSALGAAAAASMQALGWLTTQTAVMRPVWTLFCDLLYSALLVAALSGSGEWGIRLAGLVLAATSGWALRMGLGLGHDAAP